MKTPHIERRSFNSSVAAEESRKVTGTAIVYGSRSVDLGGFVEIVDPSALTRTLQDNQNIKLLFNHDSAFVIASQTNNTLQLRNALEGLSFVGEAPETTWADDVLVSVKRGDIQDCSFGFSVRKDRWEERDGIQTRTLLDVDLIEISIVTFGAYPATSVSARSLQTLIDIVNHSDVNQDQIRSAIDSLQTKIDQETQKTLLDDKTEATQKLSMLSRYLDLLKRY